VDDQVESALLKRCLGFDEDAVKILMPFKGSEPVYAPYTKKYAPDVDACKFWLCNRQKKRWSAHPKDEGSDGEKLQELVNAIKSNIQPDAKEGSSGS
jgi:hypothetical protein